MAGVVFGAPMYMAPEQVRGKNVDVRTDIYALGATLYEMLSSKPPFYSGDVASQVREVIAPSMPCGCKSWTPRSTYSG